MLENAEDIPQLTSVVHDRMNWMECSNSIFPVHGTCIVQPKSA